MNCNKWWDMRHFQKRRETAGNRSTNPVVKACGRSVTLGTGVSVGRDGIRGRKDTLVRAWETSGEPRRAFERRSADRVAIFWKRQVRGATKAKEAVRFAGAGG